TLVADFVICKEARATEMPVSIRYLESLKLCGSSQMLQLGFGRIVTKNARLLIGRCRNVDFPWDERCPIFLSVLEELCASSRYRNRRAIPKYQRGRSTTVNR